MKKHSQSRRALCRIAAFLMMLVLLVSVFGLTASADTIQKTPYDTYTYWTAPGTNWTVSSTPMYAIDRVLSGANFGLSAFKEPSDVFTDKDGMLYLVDSGNGRVVVVNKDYTLNTVIQGLSFNGEALDFTGARGVFVTSDKKIYIADTENARVIVTALDKKVSNVLRLPDADVIPETFMYRPAKVVVDSEGYIYILSDNSYYGALLYKPDGTFSGFYGSNSVKSSIMGVFDKIFDMLFVSDVQKENAEKELPFSFTDIAVDEQNFIYTATGASSITVSSSGQLKKLSPGGTNVLKNKTRTAVVSAESTNFSDGRGMKAPLLSGAYQWRVSDVASMDVDRYGFMYGLCRTYGHIFIYDQECNVLSVFGGGLSAGVQQGTFFRATAIHVDDTTQNLLVVDSSAANVTVFKETEYGAQVKKAQSLTSNGSYQEAKPYWEKVLTVDRNQQLAYRGLAKSALVEQDYVTTLKYAKLGFDQDTYASAYVHVRNDYLAQNFIWLFVILLLVVGGLIAFMVYTNKHHVQLIKNQKVRTMFSCLTHPFEGAKEIRYYNQGSAGLATGVLAVYLLSTVCMEIYSGFMYAMLDKGSYNAGFTLLRSLGIPLLWTVVNWAMSTLFQGKGKMKQIYIITCYALIPAIINNLCTMILSNVLSPEEGLALSIINTICVALTAIIICVGTMTMHEFGFFKFIVLSLVVVAAMLVTLFVLLMVFVLIQQLFTFIGTIYQEVAYR